jgi:pimeloyl-ACP methyl ester carboxylesterase
MLPMPYPNEDSFKFQGFTINYHYAQSTDTPKAILIFLHGLYGYGGNSGYMAVNVTKAIPDVNFYSLDFLNFGKSGGDCRGYIHSLEFLMDQADAFLEHILEKF